jgi:hypothetical protein
MTTLWLLAPRSLRSPTTYKALLWFGGRAVMDGESERKWSDSLYISSNIVIVTDNKSNKENAQLT